MNRDYVMLASAHKELHNIPQGYLWSIKYDGMRALWLPTARGLKVHQVPFSADPVYDRVCTGLFSRYGKVIHAPNLFLDMLPDYPLDGELWTNRNDFQRLISITRSHSALWCGVKYCVFDSPRYIDILSDGRINNSIVKEKMISYHDNKHLLGTNLVDYFMPFEAKAKYLIDNVEYNDVVKPVVQKEGLSQEKILSFLDEEIDQLGEGLIGRAAKSIWFPKRSKQMIKLKPTQDAEAVIMEHTAGVGKYAGMLGAYVVSWKGKRFKLSGMSDFDRSSPLPLGTKVTFRYKTLTEDGLPREARYIRVYTPE